MQRYFVSLDDKGDFLFSRQDIFHIQKVMRMHVNDHIEVVANNQVYLVNIDSIAPLSVSILDTLPSKSKLAKEVSVLVPILKGDKVDLIIQKATELGADNIIFYRSRRSMVKLSQEEFNKKLDRYKLIAKEASEQSRRNTIPNIEGIADIKYLDNYKKRVNIFAYEDVKGSTLSFKDEIKNKESTLVVVGPEGGFDCEEVNVLLKQHFSPVSFGNRILRVETAVIYALSVISYTLEQKQ